MGPVRQHYDLRERTHNKTDNKNNPLLHKQKLLLNDVDTIPSYK